MPATTTTTIPKPAMTTTAAPAGAGASYFALPPRSMAAFSSPLTPSPGSSTAELSEPWVAQLLQDINHFLTDVCKTTAYHIQEGTAPGPEETSALIRKCYTSYELLTRLQPPFVPPSASASAGGKKDGLAPPVQVRSLSFDRLSEAVPPSRRESTVETHQKPRLPPISTLYRSLGALQQQENQEDASAAARKGSLHYERLQQHQGHVEILHPPHSPVDLPFVGSKQLPQPSIPAITSKAAQLGNKPSSIGPIRTNGRASVSAGSSDPRWRSSSLSTPFDTNSAPSGGAVAAAATVRTSFDSNTSWTSTSSSSSTTKQQQYTRNDGPSSPYSRQFNLGAVRSQPPSVAAAAAHGKERRESLTLSAPPAAHIPLPSVYSPTAGQAYTQHGRQPSSYAQQRPRDGEHRERMEVDDDRPEAVASAPSSATTSNFPIDSAAAAAASAGSADASGSSWTSLAIPNGRGRARSEVELPSTVRGVPPAAGGAPNGKASYRAHPYQLPPPPLPSLHRHDRSMSVSASASAQQGQAGPGSTTGASQGNGIPTSVMTFRLPKYAKRSRRPAASNCHCCGTHDTPEWRKGPNGSRTLCNACGLHYAKILRQEKAALAAAMDSSEQQENGASVPDVVITIDQLRRSIESINHGNQSRMPLTPSSNGQPSNGVRIAPASPTASMVQQGPHRSSV